MDRSQGLDFGLDAFRTGEERTWELPAWGHPLSLGVFPLLVEESESELRTIGTAFNIGRAGILATAGHLLVEESLKRDRRGLRLLHEPWFPKSLELSEYGNHGLYILYSLAGHEQLHVRLLPIQKASGILTVTPERRRVADLAFVAPDFPRELPRRCLPITFRVPRIGSTIRCIGYCKSSDDHENVISLEDLREERIRDWLSYYKHRFCVVEGVVREIFTQGFAPNFVSSACFSIDVETENGLSGGPVFDENGYVCGVVSAGASLYFSQPSSSSLVSLFYPSFMTSINAVHSMAANFQFTISLPLSELVARQSIRTDGSEELVTLVPEGEEWRVGIEIHKDDANSVFDNLEGFQENRTASLATGSHLRMKKAETRDTTE